jgi:carbon-monoxide dehydrogenase small subunit
MARTHELQMQLNGEEVQLEVDPSATLAQVLRDQLGLTGTKLGCQEGECGACTVLVDDTPVDSCIYPALKAVGRSVLTIEGLADGDDLHPLQQAFLEQGAAQCGYCTPGLILSAVALLQQNPHPTEDQIRRAISGNLCRCTGYLKVVRAIQAAAESLTSASR